MTKTCIYCHKEMDLTEWYKTGHDYDCMKRPKGYQWPASRLTKEEMAILYRMKLAQKKPISTILKELIGQAADAQNIPRTPVEDRGFFK